MGVIMRTASSGNFAISVVGFPGSGGACSILVGIWSTWATRRTGPAKTERWCSVIVTPRAVGVCKTTSRTASIPWPLIGLGTARLEEDSQERLLLTSRRSPAFTYAITRARTHRESEQG